MNKISNCIAELKNKHKIIGIKADLESVGVDLFDVDKLSELANIHELNFCAKLGGVGAGSELNFLRNKKIDFLVAPMVESLYGCEKFVETVKHFCPYSQPELFINIETKTAVKNFDNILNSPVFPHIAGIVFGRSDLAMSLGLKKADVDSELIYSVLAPLCAKAQLFNKKIIVGGNLSTNSVEFLSNLKKETSICFESRYLIFSGEEISERGIKEALRFEELWQEYKNEKNIPILSSVKSLSQKTTV